MPNTQTKTCQSCNNNFTIYPEDFEFYEKIGVPNPTFCPECRLIRRLVWRNIRTLYLRKCNLTGKDIISIYSPDKPYKVYEQNIWNSDQWDPLEYGLEYDFSKSFFEQFSQLLKLVPQPNLNLLNVKNSDYCSNSGELNNCYLIFNGYDLENCMYSEQIYHCRECMDCNRVTRCEFCYEVFNSQNCFKSMYLNNCYECIESMFCYNCSNCSNCFGCVNLRNKQYCIFNKQYSKEEYKNILNKYFNGSYTNISKNIEQFKDYSLKFVRKFANILKSQDSIGDLIIESNNCKFSFDIVKCENLKYCYFVDEFLKDSMDVSFAFKQELSYDSYSAALGYKSLFNSTDWGGRENYYSFNCRDCSNCFACIGLRNKSYCILNKQYTKEEYFKMVEKIKKHMDNMPYISNVKCQSPNNKQTQTKQIIYKYGEFFPPDLSPFAYNETIAQEYFPLNKEQAQRQGFRWKDPEQRKYPIDITTDKIPDNIKDTDSSIVGKIIECAHNNKNCNEQCTTAFKIIPKEYEFYKKMNLPIPRLCPNCRHYQRIKQRNPLKLWKRRCMCNGKTSINNIYTNTIEHSHHKDSPCPNEFYTSYSPDRDEIVYCERCYQQEVV